MWKSYFTHLANTMIKSGKLAVTFADGTTKTFGDPEAEPVSIRFRDDATLRAFCLHPDLALGEAYMDERITIEGDDLPGLMKIALENTTHSKNVASRAALTALRRGLRFIQQRNPIGKAQANVKHHYDLSDELYELFLDADRQYSCAYFARPGATIEQAQISKKAHIAKKLLLSPGLTVLDIGSGWGGMGLTLAKDHGCQVTGVTLSTSQHRVSNIRAREESLSDRAGFLLMDYRSVEARFDRIVSVGMFEHVGAPHYREFFRHLRRLMKDDGVALLHTIGSFRPPGVTNPWIAKYIFPGGYIPAMSEVLAAIEKEGLVVTDVEVLRLHYAETLKCWRQRFTENIERARELYDERFCRMWRFYLIGSEMSFRYGSQVVFQFQITKRTAAAPLTRNYMYGAD